MKTNSAPLRYLASLLMLLVLFTASCGSKEGKVEGVNMLYGTESKVWKTDKELSASGDKVKQTDAQEDERITFFANKQYNMTSPAGAVNGKYEFDQAGKKITMTPDGAAQSNTFDVVTLTDDKLTLRSPEGAELRLEKE
ncbi:lipocalin family protein [Hymenobacter sp. 5516J-16]|uniref:Lipocalin family protein n=1 Tax=Hymenobacter sublimis TaxID=2933777 RepID=A0ABY4J9X1_9BACT|nr:MULTISPECIES: lipocalin family protein [Hymenobacter]UOQ78618.1 lipocalin family protein [Hymenobacter sp. 5516J-16]UPL48602.1 lipocalin family protein [Hymenobacter sublimis]